MFNLEQAIRAWLKTLRGNQGLEDGYIEELHSHLLDEIDHLKEQGKSEKEAFDTAVANLGSVKKISADYYKTNTRRWTPIPPDNVRGNFLALLFNYFKVAVRRIKRHKGYSLINVLGLAIGMACAIFILKWVHYQLSYDHFHLNARNLYAATFSNGSMVTPTALSKHLKSEYPEIIRTSRYSNLGKQLLRYEDKEINEEGGIIVEPDFIAMFTIPLLEGNKETALKEPLSLLLSEDLAYKLFGNINPINKTVTFSAQYDLKVTGVFKNYPSNSHIECEYILPLAAAKEWKWFRDLNTWNENNIRTYVQLQQNTVVGSIDKKISNVVEKHRPQDKRSLSLRLITRIHLHRHSNSPITYVYIFSTMAIFILLIACINFMNLTTARSTTLAKEVGIRKAIGAGRAHLIRQFLGETIMLTLIAFGVGVFLMALFLPTFNTLARETFSFGSLFQGSMVLGILAILLVTGILAGIYPALFLSRFQTANVVKGVLPSDMRGTGMRKVLVITQFSLAILLMLSTLMVYKQVKFLRDQDVGFNKDNIVYFGIGERFRNNFETIRTELMVNPKIVNVTLTDIAPYRWQSNAGYGDVHWQGKTNQQVKMVMVNVDTHYLKTFGMTMAHGRFFSKKLQTDVTDAFVVNETAIRAMEMDNPIGKELKIWELRGKIIGVVKDYHFESLHRKIIPMAMRIHPGFYGQACVRISPQNTAETLQFLKGQWKKIYPEYPFEYRFLDDRIHSLYAVEEAIGKLVKVFTILAIFISCLGLFGLASFMVEKRTKEIGIRKVCGASISGLIYSLSKDFLKLVFLACIIAIPLTLILTNKWLVEFAYRTSLNVGNILLITILSLSIAFITVGYHTFKSARINPTEALRDE